MGGHGGLNILPQKSWNVYNFDNRERVRKDEEAAAQKEQDEQRLARQRDSEFRLEKLREVGQTKRLAIPEGTALGSDADEKAGDSVNVVKVEHINLFKEVEERPEEGSSRQGERKGRGESKRKESKQNPADASEEQYRFAYGALGKSSKRPWYLTKSFVVDRGGDDEADDNTMSRQAQPSGLEKKKRKTLEELRAERAQREEQEKKKARKLMAAKAAAAAGFQQGGPSGRYHQSYGNAQ